MQMMRMDKPVEEGNANEIYEVCYPLIKLILLRYEAIVSFFVEEPYFIHINTEKDADKITCEKILSLYLDVPNSHTVAYIIFSNEREDFSEDWYAVVRKVYWDKINDQRQIKENPDQRDVFLKAWPSITIQNIAIKQNTIVKEIIEGMDRIVGQGIVISPRKGAFPRWKDIAVMRRFNWGEVSSCWGASHQNARTESYVFEALKRLAHVVTGEQCLLHKMALDYQTLPELFHKALIDE